MLNNDTQQLDCSFSVKYKTKIFMGLCFLVFLIIWFCPEQVLADSLEKQLDTVNDLVTKKLKVYGISGAAITGAIWSIFKGNVKMAGIIIMIGVMFAIFLNWLESGMLLTG